MGSLGSLERYFEAIMSYLAPLKSALAYLLLILGTLLRKLLGILRRYGRFIFIAFFLSPFLVSLILVYAVPSALCALMSLTDMGLKFEFTWCRPLWRNYEVIFSGADPRIEEVTYVTILYVGATLLINAGYALILGVFTAYMVKNETLATTIRLLWFLPRMTPVVIYALLWLWFADPHVGPLTIISRWIGLGEVSWILDRPYSQILMIIVNGYVGASWGMVIFASAVRTIPLELFYAAKVDGASDFQVITKIIIPLLKWPILFVTAWQTLSLIGSYVQILTIWNGFAYVSGTEVWSLYSFHKAFEAYEFGYSASLAIVMVIISLGLVALYFKIFGFRRMLEPSRIEV
ncbi:MAG: sugar ABC transporter permease [Thermoprotei archaeon]|nr:MAG: sugar ABC transporter permease [Thermoprotei archaeon]